MAADIGGLSSITLLLFLDTHKNSLSKSVLLERLNEITATILADSYSSALHVLMNKSGWDENSSSFNDINLDIETLSSSLRLFIERRGNKSSTIRASQIDVKNRIKSFAPDLLMIYTLERKALADRSKTEPFSVFFDGVCLLADISGFTRLSGKFCEGGKDGIDQLQQVVNGYLGQLVKIVYAFGGDVMKFAGDALVCVFQPNRYAGGGRELTLADTCSNAVQCATELAQICTEQLTIHVAISCGPICFAMLGGHENAWECLVSGHCLGDLSKCLDDAASKQTVVSPQLVEILGPNYRKELNIEQLSSGNYRVISAVTINSLVMRKMIKRRGEMLMKDSESRFVMFPNDDQFLSTIGMFVPMPVSVGLISGTFDYLAELREVTTMFMSWDSYNEEDHADLLSLQNCFLTAQRILAESGGFIRQFLIDDKGCVLIACWGVPTASHPDNTRRALCAGAIIGYELSELSMKTSVGITTGNVFCGSVGSYVRREYAVIGDVVNLAARLMSKAKGGLYIDEATYSRIPSFLQEYLQKLAPMALKGKDVPIAAYSLKKGMKRISLSDKGEGEINVGMLSIRPACKVPLLKGMERITCKEAVRLKCILLEGKTGTGKIDVVDWVKSTAPKKDIRVVSFDLSPVDTGSSYSLMAHLFRLLVREAIFDDPGSQKIVVKQILRHVYKSDIETIEKVAYPALKTALGVSNSSTRRLPKRVIIDCLSDIFIYLLNVCPVVLVVEHAHFADSCSWEVLLSLMGTPSYGLVVMTIVPPEDLRPLPYDPSTEATGDRGAHTLSVLLFSRLSHHYRTLTQFKSTTMVRMSDYTVLDVGQLLCSVLKLEACPEGVSSQVHQLSGGDPFWCREMAQFIQIAGTGEFSKAMTPSKEYDFETKEESGAPNSFLALHHKTRTDSSLKSLEPDVSTSHQPITSKSNGVGRRMLHTVSHRLFGSLDASEHVQEGSRMAKTGTTAQLELFIVCRLETLSREDQNILRTASIIGRQFSQEILYGILSPKMRTQMFNSVLSLVKLQWIVETEKSTARCDSPSTEYTFVHPLFYQTLYDLTPAGDKATLHYAVASYLEEAHNNSPKHYAQLGRHYGLAKECRPKAFEYFVRAAVHSLSLGQGHYEEGLDLLTQARIFGDSAMDYGTMLGVIVEKILGLKAIRNNLIAPVRTVAHVPQGIPRRSRKVQASPSAKHQLHCCTTPTQCTDKLLKQFSDLEDVLNELYDLMVQSNCVGVITNWQRPYLTRWREHRHGSEQREVESDSPREAQGTEQSSSPHTGGFLHALRSYLLGRRPGNDPHCQGGGNASPVAWNARSRTCVTPLSVRVISSPPSPHALTSQSHDHYMRNNKFSAVHNFRLGNKLSHSHVSNIGSPTNSHNSSNMNSHQNSCHAPKINVFPSIDEIEVGDASRLAHVRYFFGLV